MILGFSFKGVHSSNFGIGVRTEDRTLLPERAITTYTIPGRDGTVTFGKGNLRTRTETMRLGLINPDWYKLRIKAREIADWLYGDGQLIFDDEPDKYYDASVYQRIGMEQINLLPIAECSVAFECQPLASIINYKQVNGDFTESPASLVAINEGKAPACCIITIRNTGNQNINGINLIRKVVTK